MSKEPNSTVLPQLERAVAAAAARTIAPRRDPWWARLGRRGTRAAVIATATLALGGTALAATGGWKPLIGDLATDGPPRLTSTPVPPEIANALGVLRRQQTARDRSPAVEATLHQVSSYHVEGVRPESIRYLAPAVGGEAAIVFSAEESESIDGPSPYLDPGSAAPWAGGDPLCVFSPPAGSECFHLSTILKGEALWSEGGPSGGAMFGLVPDGVATVTGHFGDGRKIRVPVVNNYFKIPYKVDSYGETGFDFNPVLEDAAGKRFRPNGVDDANRRSPRN
jgi:hypothetical protein